MTYEQQVKRWSQAVAKSAKRVLSSKEKTRKFMTRSRIVAKGGKRLAKTYR